jgi:molybdenum cofactor cytidylyltransferase
MLLPPVYFSAAYFPELLALKGDEGAKSILKAHPADVQPVPMENLWDIDTSDDYTAFMESRS